ncbi:MAG: XRE family transcriptional regulator [Pseudonocardia sp.]
MGSVDGPAAGRLATRLRQLREHEWQDVTLTQAQLATALSAQSKVASATLSTWENVNNPKTPTTARLSAYARFFATRRSLDGKPHLIAADDLRPDERVRFEQLEEELYELHAALGEAPPPPPVVGRRLLLQFDDTGPIVIVCPQAPEDDWGKLADEKNPNYTHLHRFADADALLEMFGHIRALNPERQVLHRLPSRTRKSDLQHHLVILGGVAWNATLRRIQLELRKRLPIEHFEDSRLLTGEVFRVRDEESGTESVHFPATEEIDGVVETMEDVGLVGRLTNPFNSSRTLTICNGVHSTGVMGAVMTLTDETVRQRNEEFLADRYPTGEFAMLVRVPIVDGSALAPDLQNPNVRLFEWPPASSRAGGSSSR